jgi:hypothetical protein
MGRVQLLVQRIRRSEDVPSFVAGVWIGPLDTGDRSRTTNAEPAWSSAGVR